MNLNGVEYYYIRNGQSDIIGLFDKTGAQVVSYTYDTWGKLVSIDGSLKDTVGVKNPYRYRGYRYDTETGLYYLQSRYYNPDWGRFINADAIAGSLGELLGHNLFAYCKNSPVNGYDVGGFRMVMDPDSTVSVYNYNNWVVHYHDTGLSTGHKVLDGVTDSMGTTKGNVASGITDSGIGKGIDKIVSKVTKPIDYLFSTPKIAKFKSVVGAVGIINSISFGLSIRDDVLHYGTRDAFGRAIVDSLGFGASIFLAAATAEIWAPTVAGFALGTGASVLGGLAISFGTGLIKDAFFWRKTKK
ncbi:RHS repeat-associated core domain-containing protein [Clostridium sp. 19966]|uniref:RHS repeat-associated core domain-containing protein n=1 Tax=Clostridium sp. 19966 TaxID=2768166 RepID=UPI0028DD97BD|nr:RHS repeat-associated core domain-containing protein [Clostridium sp. 19966]MDT8719735.1 RHS repeat-associated core domain-containing protein [Clostridium sp. 19966]